LTVAKYKKMQTSPFFAALFVPKVILQFEVVVAHIKAVWDVHYVLLIPKISS
jgi:hypothetical protein